MPLYDAPTHTVTSHTVTSSTDVGGGIALTYAVAQTAIPCSINTLSSQEQERFSQQQLVVTHTVAFLTSALTTALSRGMKLVTGDNSQSFHVEGLAAGRAYGSIPAFTMAHCRQLL